MLIRTTLIFLCILSLSTEGALIPLDSLLVCQEGQSTAILKKKSTQQVLIPPQKGSYCLQATFNDPNLSNTSILITPTNYHYTIYLNNIEVKRWGNGNTENSRFSNYQSDMAVIESHLLPENTMQIFFYSDGDNQQVPSFYLGSYTDVEKNLFIRNLFNHTILAGIVIGSLFLAILFSRYWFSTKRKEMEILYFALYSLLFCIAYLITILNSQIFPEFLLFKISHIVMLFLPFMLLVFVWEYLQVKKGKPILKVLITIHIPFLLLLLTATGRGEIRNHFNTAANFIIIPELLSIIVILIVSVYKHRDLETTIILVGFFALTTGAIHDIHFLNAGKQPLFWTTPFGYFFQGISITLSILIRQRKRYNMQIEYQESLKEKHSERKEEVQVRENFIRTIAHELRTPLNGLVGGMEMLNHNSKEESEYTAHFQKSLKRLTVTLNNIFDMVAIQDRNLQIQTAVYDIVKELHEIFDFYAREAESKNVQFHVTIDKSVPKLVEVDASHLIQIIDNLLNNAVKFCEKGSVTCFLSMRSQTLSFAVSDTGPGIPKKLQSTLFSSFEKNDDFSFRQRSEGLGSGLTIINAILEKMKGELSFTSSEDGTTFIAEIPVKEVAELTKRNSAGESILVVEDNATNRVTMEKVLKRNHYRVFSAENGVEAIDALRDELIELVLMDLQMPIMDGLEATKLIRKMGYDIPIIAITANGEEVICDDCGMTDFLQKPINFEELLNKIASNLEKTGT